MRTSRKIITGLLITLVIFFVLIFSSVSHVENLESDFKSNLSNTEIKNQSIDVSYDELLRNNEEYVSKIIQINGKINHVYHNFDEYYDLLIQKEEKDSQKNIRTIWVNYKGDRLLVQDDVEIFGKVVGIKEYTTTQGNRVFVPEINVLILNVLEK